MIYNGTTWLHKKNNEVLWREELLHFKITTLYPFLETVILIKLRWQVDEPILEKFLGDMNEIGYSTDQLLNKLQNYDEL